MRSRIHHPTLYQINTRVVLRELSARLGRPATLADIPDQTLDRIADLGINWVWLLGVWRLGEAGIKVSRSNPEWRREYAHQLPDLKEDDISGSPFAVTGYTADARIGGDAELSAMRERLAARSIKLLLDFVPNHTALDHPWVASHPDYYIQGDSLDAVREPHNYRLVSTNRGETVLAHGRDPFFPGWPDTLQLNYRCAALRDAVIRELEQIASRCDGVRCDMAMLLLPEVIARTWGNRSNPADRSAPIDRSFWLDAIPAVRSRSPEFVFMAEVYWDLEWALQEQGFDFTYDKRLYDRLRSLDTTGVRDHLRAGPAFQERSVRFLENHDEERAAESFSEGAAQAAAVVAFTIPGLRFFHEGQFEGRSYRVSMHLNRRRAETPDPSTEAFYNRLLVALKDEVFHGGRWELLACNPAWEGNPTYNQFLAWRWESDRTSRLITVNYGETQGQCYVQLPLSSLRGKKVVLRDVLGSAVYERDGDELIAQGLYLDMAAFGYHVFEVQ